MSRTKEEIRESIAVSNPVPIVPETVEAAEAPAVEEEVEKPETVEAAVVDEPTEEVETEEETPAEPEEETVSKKTMLKRVARENAKYLAEQAKSQQLESELAKLRGNNEGEAPTPEEIKKQARLEAQQEIQAEQFNNACNNLAAAAEKENPKSVALWKEVLNDISAPITAVNHVLEAMLNLENGHSVLNYLANNEDKAETVFGLSPTKQAIELAKISENLKKPKVKAPSKVPAPITPIGGNRQSVGTYRDDMSMEDYAKYRASSRRPMQFK
jgi:hypothetical protein